MTIKDQADQIVERYRPHSDGYPKSKIETENATKCAIKEVEAFIDVLGKLHKPEYTSFVINGEVIDGYELIGTYALILNELKSRI
jgi:hypothetical protein